MAALAWVYTSDVTNWGVSRWGKLIREQGLLQEQLLHCVCVGGGAAAERARPGRGLMSLGFPLLCMRYDEHFCVGNCKELFSKY